MKKLLFSLFAILAIVACADNGPDDSETPQAPEITLDATVANFTTESGSTTVTFTSSDSWSAEVVSSRAVGWCSVMPTCGGPGNAKITIKTSANKTPDDRTASIVIKSGTTEKIITVSQKQKDALTVTSSRFEVSANGGEVEIEVKANIDFEYAIDESASDWVEYQGTRAMKASTLVFKVGKNDGEDKREAKIAIKSGELCEEVSIYQVGSKPSIILSQNKYTIPSAGETIAVAIQSGVDAEVEMPSDVDWITESTTRAESPHTYYFDIASNEDYDARSAEIKFINKKNNQSEIVTIYQVQKNAIVVADDSYTIDCEGGEIEIELGHNVDFDIAISADWITQQQTRGLETTKLTFVVAKNGATERDGKIVFTAKDKSVSQTVVVTQQEKVSKLYVEVSCDEETLRKHIAQYVGDYATSVEKKGDGYVISLQLGYHEIPDAAFMNCEWLTHIVIDDDITSIGVAAFRSCNNLTNVTIPGSVNVIRILAFAYCRNLTNVVISDGVMVIGEMAFGDCKSLTSVTIPNSVYMIEGQAFAYCSALTSVTIPNGVTSIGSDVFNYCDNLESFYGKYASEDNRCLITSSGSLFGFAPAGLTTYAIPDGVTSIGSTVFVGCENLVSITIPNSVTEIGEEAFRLCGITSIDIPDSVTSIGSGAFSSCRSLTSINLPDGITEIKGNTFSSCVSLRSITIPDSVTEIGRAAFSGCSSLESFYGKMASEDHRCLIIGRELVGVALGGLTEYTIPDGITSLRQAVFQDCELTSLTIPNGFKEIPYCAFFQSSLRSVTIPDSVTSIGSAAFYGCDRLKSVTIPDSVTSIGSQAFRRCDNLTSITIPNGVTKIEYETFGYCFNLTSVTIPDSVTYIEENAFLHCIRLEEVTIPENVTYVGKAAFTGCSGLKSLYCKPTTPPKTNVRPVNFGDDQDCKIYVPRNSVYAYKSAPGWDLYSSYIEGYDF